MEFIHIASLWDSRSLKISQWDDRRSHIHIGVQWSQGVETVMIACPDQAFHGGCDPSSLGCSHDSSTAEYLGESHITSSVNGTCGLDDLPEHFPLQQAGDSRTYVDLTWEVTAQLLCRFP